MVEGAMAAEVIGNSNRFTARGHLPANYEQE